MGLGREFTDGTVTGLFARPVSRAALAAAKLVLLLGWMAALVVGLLVGIIAAGLMLDVGPAGPRITGFAVKLLCVGLLTRLLALLAAPVATMGRGYLSAIAALIGSVVLAAIATYTASGRGFRLRRRDCGRRPGPATSPEPS